MQRHIIALAQEAVERKSGNAVANRVGLVPAKATADQDHDIFLELLEPDEMHEAHVNLIQHGRKVCHSQRPAHELCPLRERCRFVDPKAP